MSSQPDYPDNELATFTSEGHEDFMRRIEEVDESEPASASKAPKKRVRRRRPTKQELAKAVHFEQEQEFLASIAGKEEDDNESVKADKAHYSYKTPEQPQESDSMWTHPQQQQHTDIFSYFSEPFQFRQGP